MRISEYSLYKVVYINGQTDEIIAKNVNDMYDKAKDIVKSYSCCLLRLKEN